MFIEAVVRVYSIKKLFLKISQNFRERPVSKFFLIVLQVLKMNSLDSKEKPNIDFEDWQCNLLSPVQILLYYILG